MSDGLPPPRIPPGWYPEPGAQLRWWDGARWTDFRALRAGRRNVDGLNLIGTVLLLVAPFSLVVAVLSIMGDPFPVARAGATLQHGELTVVNAGCPGERLVGITLWRTSPTGPGTPLWEIEGDTSLPPSLRVGEVPAGMHVVTPFVDPSLAEVPLSLRVTTSELDGPASMEFTLADVPPTGVLSYGNSYASVSEFERATLDDTPCGDPYGKKGPEEFAAVTLLLGLAAGVLGVGVLVLAHRPSRRRPRST